MKTQIALSIEQMKHLEELGLDTSDASMMWVTYHGYPSIVYSTSVDFTRLVPNIEDYKLDAKTYTLTYTLQDILNKLPQQIHCDEDIIEIACLNINPMKNGGWNMSYEYSSDGTKLKFKSNFKNQEILEAAYNMLCWVIENGFIKH